MRSVLKEDQTFHSNGGKQVPATCEQITKRNNIFILDKSPVDPI